jgi:hypothetical protein
VQEESRDAFLDCFGDPCQRSVERPGRRGDCAVNVASLDSLRQFRGARPVGCGVSSSPPASCVAIAAVNSACNHTCRHIRILLFWRS